jgi:hypothetical protein
MKTLVKLPEPNTQSEYPKLMIMPDVVIVLFFEHGKGLIIKSFSNYTEYTYNDKFLMADFIDFDGEITLKNN